MLNEKTTSANNLRVQSSRRHQIRNLRAKVRSLLPEQICVKQSKRLNKNHRHDQILRKANNHTRNSSYQQRNRLIKQLQKLTQKELQEICQNKYYFLGNQQIIYQFDQFIREFHPKIKQRQWTSPQLLKTSDMPFGFVPPFLSLQKESRNSLTSGKKRGSTATSVHLQKVQSIMNRQVKSQCKTYKQFQNNFLQRKHAIEEQLKAKRQISSVHLQRQQHIAEVNRTTLLRQRIQKAKVTSSLTKFSKYKEQKDISKVFQSYDVSSLTAKLRKICLKNYKRIQNN